MTDTIVQISKDFGIIVAAITAMVLALKPAALTARKALRWFRSQEYAKDTVSNLTHLQTINDQMWAIENTIDSVERVLLFAGHNCGGLPSLEKPYYVTQIGKAIDPDHRIRLGDYTKVEVGRQYIAMLLDVFKKREISFVTRHEPEGQLKDYYTNEGVEEAKIFFLKITRSSGSFLFISISTYQKQGFSDDDKRRIRHLMTTIQSSAQQLK